VHRRSIVLSVVAGLAALTVAPSALGATFTASSTADMPDRNPGDDRCLTENQECTLRAAVMETNAQPHVLHTIVLLGGAVYTLNRTGPHEDDAALGDLDLASKVSITVPGGRATVRAAGGFDDRIFDVRPGAAVGVDAVDVRNGREDFGAGIRNDGRLTLANTTVSGNVSGLEGGGIENHGVLALDHTTVTDNSASVEGGGIENAGGTLTVASSSVSGNTARDNGGGIALHAGSASLVESTISGNSSNHGGGIAASGSLASLTVLRSTVRDNRADGADQEGGGIFLTGGVPAVVDSSTISGNRADRAGGGIYALGGTTLQLRTSTISGNSSLGDGGGIWNAGTIIADYVTIAANTADANGNGTGEGGGVFNPSGGLFSAAGTLVADNVDASPSIKAPDCLGSFTSRGYNLLETPTGCTIGGDSTSFFVWRDPQLGPLADNGGPTLTHALEVRTNLAFPTGSIAVDSGGLCTGTDQRGVQRPVDGNFDGFTRCDIGAYERVPVVKLGPGH
jgi:hypothetical protein